MSQYKVHTRSCYIAHDPEIFSCFFSDLLKVRSGVMKTSSILISLFTRTNLQLLDHKDKTCGQLKNSSIERNFPRLLTSLNCSLFMSNADKSFSIGFLHTKNEK